MIQMDHSSSAEMNICINRNSIIAQSDQFIDRYIHIKQAEQERLKFVMMINSFNAQNIDFDDDDKLVMVDDNKSSLLQRASEYILANGPFAFTVAPINEDKYKWLGMQLRWIVWTLASYERKNPREYLGSLLTSENLFKLLNHRYTLYNGCYRSVSTDVKTAPKLGFAMDKSDLLNFLLKSNSVRHFNRIGSQSSLQRCADIGVLLNPMILCFSMHAGSYEVTDGWWWIKVVLDGDLVRLVENNSLCDGVKIAVLSAAFELEGSSFSMKLFYNSVKKARGDAPLGFMRPQNGAGLSLQAVSANGGNVALAHVKLLTICSPMAKIQKRYGDTTCTVDKRSSSLKHLIMDASELIEYRRLTEKRREAIVKEVENDDDLKLENILDDVCSDENIISIIKNSIAGYEVTMDYDQQREVNKVMSRVKQLQQDTATKLMNQKVAELNSDETIYVDALVRDLRSQTLAWIRCMIQRNDSEKITDKMSVFSSFPLGSVIALSNINKMRPTLCSTPLFVLRSNSACTMSSVKSTSCNLNLGLGTIQLEPIEFLRTTMETPWGNYSDAVCATKLGSEISLLCTIIGWRKIYENDEPYIEITTLDKSRVTAIILYPYDNNSNTDNILSNITTNCGLRWLKKAENIVVSLGMIRDVDHTYDIVRLIRHDRTVIKSASTNNKNDNSIYSEICEDEINRYTALCENKITYRSSSLTDTSGVEYYCKRFHCYNARMVIGNSTTTIENFKEAPIKVTDGSYTYDMIVNITTTPIHILTAMGITYKSSNPETYTISATKYNEVFDIVYIQEVNDTNDKCNRVVVYVKIISPEDYLNRIKTTKKFI